MNKRTSKTVMDSKKRLLSIEEASDYLSLGMHKTRDWCAEIGAVVKIGGRVLIDKAVIDRHLDSNMV